MGSNVCSKPSVTIFTFKILLNECEGIFTSAMDISLSQLRELVEAGLPNIAPSQVTDTDDLCTVQILGAPTLQ